jgi:hypothetical protein
VASPPPLHDMSRLGLSCACAHPDMRLKSEDQSMITDVSSFAPTVARSAVLLEHQKPPCQLDHATPDSRVTGS